MFSLDQAPAIPSGAAFSEKTLSFRHCPGAGGGGLPPTAGNKDDYSTLQTQRWLCRYGALVNATSVTRVMPRS